MCADREEFDARSQRKVSVGWGPPVGMGILAIRLVDIFEEEVFGENIQKHDDFRFNQNRFDK